MNKTALSDPVSVHGLITQLDQDITLGRAVLVFRPVWSKERLEEVEAGSSVPGYYTVQGVDGTDWKPLLDTLEITQKLGSAIELGTTWEGVMGWWDSDNRHLQTEILSVWTNGVPLHSDKPEQSAPWLSEVLGGLTDSAKAKATAVMKTLLAQLQAARYNTQALSTALAVQHASLLVLLEEHDVDNFERNRVVATCKLRLLEGVTPSEIANWLKGHSDRKVRGACSDYVTTLCHLNDLARREATGEWDERIRLAAIHVSEARGSSIKLL